MSALLSECGTYRYELRRPVPCALRWVKPALFILFNPSTADASVDDGSPAHPLMLGYSNELKPVKLKEMQRLLDAYE